MVGFQPQLCPNIQRLVPSCQQLQDTVPGGEPGPLSLYHYGEVDKILG